MLNKTLFVILDGAADKQSQSAFSRAKMPNLDFLASNSLCGLWSGPHASKGYNVKNMSNLATLELLGYGEKDDPGRGYLEALGIGLKPDKNSIYLRANFGTVGKDMIIKDRRAGRNYQGLDVLAKQLNMTIDGIRIRFQRSVGHRGVVVLTGKGLSRDITDSDFGKKKPQKIKALSKGSEKTARILNEFLQRAHVILEKHPVNKKRSMPANYILVRGAGSSINLPSFKQKFGLRACSVSGVGIIKGISLFLGIDVIEFSGASADFETDLKGKIKIALDSLEKYDFVLLHINGADICGHDRNIRKKIKFLEKVDKEVFSQIIELRNINIIITSDHETSVKTGEHIFGPVPLLLYNPDAESNRIKKFDEKNCKNGFITESVMNSIISFSEGCQCT